MSIYRCNKCGFIAETVAIPTAGKISCSCCANLCAVYDTAFYVGKLIERHLAALREIEALKAPDKAEPTPAPSSATPLPADLDLHNTALLATAAQHAPLKQWFSSRQIEATFDFTTVDTTGFYDDAAHALADNFALFGELLERVRYAYRSSHSGLSLKLADLSQKDAQAINTLCRQFYSHTLFAHYRYQKQEKTVGLTLQTAPVVRQFFEGSWLEWFALMELMKQLTAKDSSFSCARNVKVVFPNEDLHELDVLALVNGQTLICIECKTGEFRRDIDKCLRLKKRLGLTRQQFIICASDLTDEQAAGLSAMYELTFANLNSLKDKLQAVL